MMPMAKKDPRLTPRQIDRLLANNPNKITLDVAPVNTLPEAKVMFKGCSKDYDSLNAVEQVRSFCAFIKDVVAKYEENKRRQEEAETMEMDIEHAIELAEKLTEKEKKQLYSKLTEVLQTRRACKSENEIIEPLYTYLWDNTLYNKLSQIQGIAESIKGIISNRTYSCRTDVLSDFRPSVEE